MSAHPGNNATNILSVDVEDYFQVEAFADVVDRASWESYPSRVEANTCRLLDLFEELQVKATFFILGWVAERYPQIVREIVGRGHEPACHSYWHRLVYTLAPKEFRDDTRRSKDVIEQAAGVAVQGYRAPSYSITQRSLWAFEILAEAGFLYDSSIFPIWHDIYGVPNAPSFPFRIATRSGFLTEYPITTFRLLKQNFPVGGGGYLRILPFWYTRLGVQRVAKQGVPLIVYVHPWELDPEQPRIRGRLKSRLRHYTNLTTTSKRLERLLSGRAFGGFQARGIDGTAPLVDLSLLGVQRTEWPQEFAMRSLQ